MPLPKNDPIDIAYLDRTSWWDKVDVQDETECWPWTKSTASHGYGNAWDGTTVRLAHRIAWVLHNRTQIPDEMTIDHICHNRICCNPSHLRILGNVENATDNGQKDKQFCPKGHEYSNKNLYVDPNGHRRCRTCSRDRGPDYNEKQRAYRRKKKLETKTGMV